MKLFRGNKWQDLGSVTFTVPAGSYKADITITSERGRIDKTIVVVPNVSVKRYVGFE